MVGTIGFKDNGVNEAVSQGLANSRSAGNGVRRFRSSSNEILTTRVGRKKFHLKFHAVHNHCYRRGNWRT